MATKADKKLKIAIIHPDLGIGGAERLIVDAAVQLASHGHTVHIFTGHHDKTRCFEETLGDLLLAQHTTILRRMYRKPIDVIEELTTGMADLILVNSKFTASTFAQTFKDLHTRGLKPAVLYPAVNVDQFYKPKTFKLNFLSINRFERKKNIELAISAFAMLQTLQRDLADVSLTIAGGFDNRLRENVEYLEELKSLADKEGVSGQVNFITSCSTTERNMLLSECICVLYTPKDEHFGIVPLEAMAAYKPVIACNSGGPVETIRDGVTGFLCNPTAQEFSLAMAKLVQDLQLAEKMGEAARQHVSEIFSTSRFGQRLNQYLLDVARMKDK